MERSVEEEDEEKSVDFHENPIPVYPVKVYNKYVVHDYSNPNWHYIYKINCFLFAFGLSVGYLLGVYLPLENP